MLRVVRRSVVFQSCCSSCAVLNHIQQLEVYINICNTPPFLIEEQLY